MEEKKKVPGYIKVCVIMAAVTLLLSGLFFIVTNMYYNKLVKKAYELKYSEVKAGNSLKIYSNNQVMLEDSAYTLVAADTVEAFPDGEKLIAIYAQIESEEYKAGRNPLSDVYLEYNGEYKQPMGHNLLSDQLEPMGFTSDNSLSIFYAGNGHDESGFLFFFVPEDITEVTAYIEEYDVKQRIRQIENIYTKKYTILEPSMEEINQLAAREVLQ